MNNNKKGRIMCVMPSSKNILNKQMKKNIYGLSPENSQKIHQVFCETQIFTENDLSFVVLSGSIGPRSPQL